MVDARVRRTVLGTQIGVRIKLHRQKRRMWHAAPFYMVRGSKFTAQYAQITDHC